MSNPIQVPLVNGVVYSFQHITLNIAGIEITGGFKEINYNRKRNRTMVRSNSPDPVGKTLGENEYTCTAVVYLSWWNAVVSAITQTIGSTGWGDFPFDIFVSYRNNGFDPFTDSIQNCTLDSGEASQSAGTDPLMRTIDFSPTKILYNGVDDLVAPLFAPAQNGTARGTAAGAFGAAGGFSGGGTGFSGGF